MNFFARYKKVIINISVIVLLGFSFLFISSTKPTGRDRNPEPILQSSLPPASFSDGFENAGSIDDLLRRDLSRWHGTQREPEENIVALSRELVHTGQQALKMYATPKPNFSASKADIVRELLSFKWGEHVYFSGWYYLVRNKSAQNLFLWDLEAPKESSVSPGRRIFLSGKDFIVSDLGKSWDSAKFRQEKGKEISFPKDRWVNLKIHMFLSEGNDGTMEVWQDNTKVLDAKGKTLPSRRAIYERLQVGITANGGEHNQTLYVDDIAISKTPLW